MCRGLDGHQLKARQYLTAAKRETMHLKKLKSVSRAYRKSKVRGLKALAREEEISHEIEEAKRAEMRKLQDHALAHAHGDNYEPFWPAH